MGSDSDLLIFKMRGLGSPTTSTTSAPAESSSQVMAYPAAEPKPQKAEASSKEAEVPRVTRYKPREKGESWGEEKPTPSSIYYKEGDDYPNPMKYYKEAIAQNQGDVESAQVPTPRTGAENRAMAKNLYCVAHPFRHAYMICDFCHRPFCFEDIVEYQKGFYCIEDMDKISTRYTDKLTYEYSASSLITSFALLAGFLIYLYYAHSQLAFIVGFMIATPLNFITNIQVSYVVSLLLLLLMVITFGASVYILLGSREGHVTAAVISMLAVMFFVYQYVTIGTEWIAILAVIEFGAFLSAVHSTASGAQVFDTVYEKGPEYGLAYGYGARF